MADYTFHDYCRAAKVTRPPKWAKSVRMKKKPMAHQVEALREGLTFPLYADYSEPGTGKSLTAQALAILRAAAGNKVIILTPPKLNLQFHESMLADFEGLPLTVEVYNGEVAERQATTDRYEREGWPDILIMSYLTFMGEVKKVAPKVEEYWKPTARALAREAKAAIKRAQAVCAKRRPECLGVLNEMARLANEISDKLPKKPPAPAKDVVDRNGNPVTWQTFRDRKFSFLVVDEAIVAKNHTSKIHRAIEGFRGVPAENGLWLMTGSPIENTPVDAYGFFALLSPLRYGSFRSFERMHVVIDTRSKFRKVLGYDNMGYLHTGLYATGRRVLKRDVMDLPKVSYSDVPVRLSSIHKELYDRLVNEMLIELPDDTMLDFTSASKLYQAAQRVLLCPEAVTRVAVKGNAMLETVDELIESLGGRKVMIGAWYQDSVRMLLSRLKKHNPVALFGGTDGKATEAAKDRFVNDPDCKVVITNFKSGGVGVDGLQTVCSDAIMAEMITVPGLCEQWVSRLDRKGQKEPVTVRLLVPKGTIAVKLRQSLLRKEADANRVIGDKRQLIRDLLGET